MEKAEEATTKPPGDTCVVCAVPSDLVSNHTPSHITQWSPAPVILTPGCFQFSACYQVEAFIQWVLRKARMGRTGFMGGSLEQSRHPHLLGGGRGFPTFGGPSPRLHASKRAGCVVC